MNENEENKSCGSYSFVHIKCAHLCFLASVFVEGWIETLG